MKLARHRFRATPEQRLAARAGFTMIELIVAAAIGTLIVGGAYLFLIFSLRAMAGVSSQAVLTQKGGNAIEIIQKRVRFATTNFVSPSGNTLTLAFDDNPAVDSDGNGRAFDDRNHYEQFKFIGFSSTNAADCLTNKLVYIANTNTGTQQILISTGVRNLPGFKIFSTPVGYPTLVVIRFGVSDSSSINHYQAIDLQGTAVSLNRALNTSVISIYP